jgi:hypothetical protein
MQVLAPIYLLGFLAISAPILIHLIRRRKLTVVPWAAHRFLLSVTKKLQKRKRINDWILLLLRCLLFILLALLFARPFFANQQDAVHDTTSTIVFLVDASASMDYSNGVQSRFDLARERVDSAVTDLAAGTSVALILFAEQAYPVVSPPTLEHHVVVQELVSQSTRPETSNLGAGLTAALEVLSGREGGRIVLITDGQASVWQDAPEVMRLLEQAQSVSLSLVNVASSPDAVNLGITEFQAEQSSAIAGQVVHLRATVKNGGTSVSQEVRLVLEKQLGFPVEEAWVPALQPGQATDVHLQIIFEQFGWQNLTARLARDNLATDDSRSLGLLVTSGLRVGLIEGPASLERAVAPGFFLAAAAVPVSGVAERSFPVQLSVLNLERLGREQVKDYNVLLLAGVSVLTSAQTDVLRDFVSQGGGLWLIPPSDVASLNTFIQSPLVRQLFPEQELLLKTQGAGVASAGPYAHAITGFWNSGHAGSLARFYTEQYLQPSAETELQSILNLSGGVPLFSSTSSGAGRIIFSAIPLDGTWSELPLSPQFVPLVQRSLHWLSGSVEAVPAVAPGDAWSVRVPAINVGRPFYVRRPESEGVGPVAGHVEFRNGQAIIAYSDTGSLGRYQIYLDPEGPVVGSFAVNLNAEESDLRTLSSEELGALVTGRMDWITEPQASGGRLTGIFAVMPEIWVMLTFIIILIGALELYLAQRFSQN